MFDPAATMKELAEDQPVAQGLLVFIIVVSLNVITGRGLYLVESGTSPALIPESFHWAAGVSGAVLYLVVLLVMSGLYSLLGEVFYGHGNARGLLAALSFACVPGALAGPLHYAAVLAGLEFGGIISALVSLWVLVLQVLALRQALTLGTSQAVLLFCLPLIAALLLLIVVITVAAIGVIPVL